MASKELLRRHSKARVNAQDVQPPTRDYLASLTQKELEQEMAKNPPKAEWEDLRQYAYARADTLSGPSGPKSAFKKGNDGEKTKVNEQKKRETAEQSPSKPKSAYQNNKNKRKVKFKEREQGKTVQQSSSEPKSASQKDKDMGKIMGKGQKKHETAEQELGDVFTRHFAGRIKRINRHLQ